MWNLRRPARSGRLFLELNPRPPLATCDMTAPLEPGPRGLASLVVVWVAVLSSALAATTASAQDFDPAPTARARRATWVLNFGQDSAQDTDAPDPDASGSDGPEEGVEDELPAPRGSWDRTRKDGIPPVALDHTQVVPRGQWRLEYRFQTQRFDGLRDGRDDLDEDDLFGSSTYSVLPESMTWERHTLQGLYGVDDRWTLYLTVPFVSKSIDNVTDSGDTFSQRASDFGDMEIGAIWAAYEGERSLLRADVGVSLPTGPFDAEDNDENGERAVLPYPMQIGSGSVTLIPGATWMVQMKRWTWGVQGRGRIYLHDNSDDWRVGDSFRLNLWASGAFTRSLVGSLRLEQNWWGDYHGQSSDLDPERNPLESPARQGGSRTDLLAGLSYDIGDGYEHINRFEVEFGVPIDEWLDGPQMSTEWLFTFGWRYAF